MKKSAILAIVAAWLNFGAAAAYAKTVTEGTLDVQNLATQITGDLQEYARTKDILLDNIQSVQAGLGQLKEDYHRAGTENDKLRIRAATLKETSDLLDFYGQFYELNIQTVQRILPRLETMRKAAYKGVLGKAARQLQDPEFRQNMTNLYGNLSAFAMAFGDNKSKKEVASLLGEFENLYAQGKSGADIFNNIIQNIDKVSEFLRSLYATTKLRANILQTKKYQAELAVELMEYTLALKPLKEAMEQMNPDGIMEVPEIDLAEFVDPIVEDSDTSGGPVMAVGHDPEIDRMLQGYQNGPGFLK